MAEAETGAAAAGETAGDEGVMGGEEEAGEGEGEGAEAGARAGGKFSVPSEPYRYFKFKPGQTGKPVLLLIYSTGSDPAGICNRLHFVTTSSGGGGCLVASPFRRWEQSCSSSCLSHTDKCEPVMCVPVGVELLASSSSVRSFSLKCIGSPVPSLMLRISRT